MIFSPKRAAAAAAAAANATSSSSAPPHYRHRAAPHTPSLSTSASPTSASPFSTSSSLPAASSAPPPPRRCLPVRHALSCARRFFSFPSRRAAVFSAIDLVFICMLLYALRFLWHFLYVRPHFRIEGAVDPMRLQLWSRVHRSQWHDRTRPLIDLIVRPRGAPHVGLHSQILFVCIIRFFQALLSDFFNGLVTSATHAHTFFIFSFSWRPAVSFRVW